MENPRKLEVDLFGNTYDLNLTAGHLRIAEFEGQGVDPSNVQDRNDFDLGMQLVYIALLPSLPDKRDERDVVQELIDNDMANEAAQHCLGQYLEMQDELGKFLEDLTDQALTDS